MPERIGLELRVILALKLVLHFILSFLGRVSSNRIIFARNNVAEVGEASLTALVRVLKLTSLTKVVLAQPKLVIKQLEVAVGSLHV